MSANGRVGTIDSETQFPLAGGQGSTVGSVVVQFEVSTSPAFVGQISIVGRTQRVSDSDIDRSLLAIAYKDFQTGENATAAITANKSILVDASGLELYADCTSLATGSVDFSAIPLRG